MTFSQWMRRQRHNRFRGIPLPVVDFVTDALTDINAPVSGTLSTWEQHLADHGACDNAVGAMRKAWAMFEAQRGTTN